MAASCMTKAAHATCFREQLQVTSRAAPLAVKAVHMRQPSLSLRAKSVRSISFGSSRPRRVLWSRGSDTHLRLSAVEDETTTTTDDESPWERQERIREEDDDVPYGLYLLACAIIVIAMVGTIFEYAYQNPLFSIIQPDSVLYKPICAIFVFTGFPSTYFLWTKAIKAANAETERQDKIDGY